MVHQESCKSVKLRWSFIRNEFISVPQYHHVVDVLVSLLLYWESDVYIATNV